MSDNGPTPSKQSRLSTPPPDDGGAVTDKPPTPPSWPPRSPVPEPPSIDDISKLTPQEAPNREEEGAKPALKDCNKEGPETAKDFDFVPPGMIDVCGTSSTLQGDSRLFFKAAEKLEVLPKDSKLDDEAPQYRAFLKLLKDLGCNPTPLVNRNVDYYETPHGIWLSTHLRYKNRRMRARTIIDNAEKDYWTKNNGSAPTLAKHLKDLLKATPTKPVCVIICEQQLHQNIWHSQLLIINPVTRKAYVKDSLPICHSKEAQGYAAANDLPLPPIAVVKQFSFDLLSELEAQMKPEKDVRLVGSLQYGEEETNTDCWRECYKAVGDVLDGNFVWNRELDNVSRLFNIKAKKEV